MEKRTGYAEFSSQLNDKNIVVLEFGRHHTRCGFAGESAPRAIIKSCVSDKQGRQTYLYDINNPEELKALLGDFLENIYFNYLAVSPKEKKMVVVESVFCKSIFRNTLTRVFFDQFNIPAILYVPNHLMALATLGRSTGLIVDMGVEECISIAVVDGVTLLDGSQFASLGARAIDSLISNELSKQNPDLKARLTPEIVEDIRTKTCFVAPFQRGLKMTSDKHKRSRDIQQEAIKSAEEKSLGTPIDTIEDCYFLGQQDDESPKTLNYSFRGSDAIKVPGNLREGACEILFELFAHEHSLTTLIIETIISAPIDCRRSLAENILVIGGLANLPGLEHRLSDELRNIEEYERFVRKIPNEFKFHKPICPRNYVCWLGASMFCTANAMELRSITRDQWVRDGKKNLKDWSDLNS